MTFSLQEAHGLAPEWRHQAKTLVDTAARPMKGSATGLASCVHVHYLFMAKFPRKKPRWRWQRGKPSPTKVETGLEDLS